MENQDFIAVDMFCKQHNIEISFLYSLQDFGLLQIIVSNDGAFIPADQLLAAERLVRFYADLDINLEGVDTIIHLLHRIADMQTEIQLLKNRLNLYETYAQSA